MKYPAKRPGILVSIVVIVSVIAGYELYRYQNIFFISSRQQPPPAEPGTTQTLADQASELQVLVEEVSDQTDYSRVDIVELASRLAALFPSDIQSRTLATVPPLDLDQIKDAQRNYELLELEYWIGVAIELGISLEPLSPYGLEALDNGSYRIDLQKYPEWVTNHISLLKFRDKESLPVLLRGFLLPLGFKQDDVNALETYLDSRDPYLDTARGVVAVMDAEYARVKSLQLDPQTNMDVYRLSYFRMNYLANRVRQRIWVDWGLGLLNSLSPEGQEIVVRFGREGAGDKVLIPSMPEDIVQIHIQELEDHKYRDAQAAYIGELKEKANVPDNSLMER
jgi:hypothetical protein